MSINAALWSAVAASFAAFSSAAIYVVQRRNLYEVVRPELVFTNWTRRDTLSGGRPCTIVRIDKIRNVGKGSALHLLMNSFRMADDDRPMSGSSARLIDIMPVGESIALGQEIIVFWNNVPAKTGSSKHLATPIEVTCYDTIGHHVHHTRYNLIVFQDENSAGMDMLAPGVFGRRHTSRESIRWRKVKRKIHWPQPAEDGAE
jgi:hypothetical protein